MNTKEFIESIQHTYAQGLTIVQKKNQDYANSINPFQNFEASGIIGVCVERAILLHVLTKITRISNLIDKPPAVVDESLEDTLVDTINYLAILKAYRERHKSVAGISGLGGRNQERDTDNVKSCGQGIGGRAEQGCPEPASNQYKEKSEHNIYGQSGSGIDSVCHPPRVDCKTCGCNSYVVTTIAKEQYLVCNICGVATPL